MVRSTRRTALLDAAAQVIAEHGVRGLRVEDVAERAGVVVSLLYYYFDGRAGLLEATLDHVNDRSLVADESAPDNETALQTLERILLTELAASDEVRNNCVVWNELTASAVFDPALREKVARSTSRWTADIAALLRSGQLEGSVDESIDPDAEAQLLTALLEGLIIRWLTGSVSRQRARRLLTTQLQRQLAPSPQLA